MGLAPYAKDYYKSTYNKIFKDIISFDQKTLVFKAKFPLNKFIIPDRYQELTGEVKNGLNFL